MNDDLAIMDLKDIKDYLIECHYNIESIDYAIKVLESRKDNEDAKQVLKPMCRYLGKCMSHPEINREYYDYCDLYREDCNCQCLCKDNSV